MVRWLALGLIAANLLYAGWQWRHQAAAPDSAPPEGESAAEYSGAAPLTLLSERSPQQLQQMQQLQQLQQFPAAAPDGDRGSATPASIPQAEPAQAALCASLGPFAEKISARQVQGRLADVDIPAELRLREAVVRTDHWVHIPPLGSRGEALDVLQALQQRKIDSFLITDGELTNGISLGIFSREESAQMVAAKYRERGYEVAIRELPRSAEQQWLIVQPEFATAIDPELLDRLRKGGVEMGFLRQPCIDVAQTP